MLSDSLKNQLLNKTPNKASPAHMELRNSTRQASDVITKEIPTLEALWEELSTLEDPPDPKVFETHAKINAGITFSLVAAAFIASTPYIMSATTAPGNIAKDTGWNFLGEDGAKQLLAILTVSGSGVGNALLTLGTMLYCYKNTILLFERIHNERIAYLKKITPRDSAEAALTAIEPASIKITTRPEWIKFAAIKAMQIGLATLTGSFSAEVYLNVLSKKNYIPRAMLNPMYWLILIPSIAEPYVSLDSVPRIMANLYGSLQNFKEEAANFTNSNGYLKESSIVTLIKIHTHTERVDYLIDRIGLILSKLTHTKKSNSSKTDLALLTAIFANNNSNDMYRLLENIIGMDDDDIAQNAYQKTYLERFQSIYANSTLLTFLAKTTCIVSFSYVQLMYLASTYMDQESDYPDAMIFIANAVLWFLGVWTLLNLSTVRPHSVGWPKHGAWEGRMGLSGFWVCALFGGALAYMLTRDNYDLRNGVGLSSSDEVTDYSSLFLDIVFDTIPRGFGMMWSWATASLYNAMFAEGALEFVGRLLDRFRDTAYKPEKDGYNKEQMQQIEKLFQLYKVIIVYQSNSKLKDIMAAETTIEQEIHGTPESSTISPNVASTTIGSVPSSLNAKINLKLSNKDVSPAVMHLRNAIEQRGTSPWARMAESLDSSVLNPIGDFCSRITEPYRNTLRNNRSGYTSIN